MAKDKLLSSSLEVWRCLFVSVAGLQGWICITFIWVSSPVLRAFYQIVPQYLFPQLPSLRKTEASNWAERKDAGSAQTLWIAYWGTWDTCVPWHQLLSPSTRACILMAFVFFHFFLSFLWLTLVFIFHLWMDKLFLHVLCLLQQIFNYPFSIVLTWTYEQLPKSADKGTTFPIVCHNICFLWNIPGMWPPASISCRPFWNFFQRHVQCCECQERVWSLCSHFFLGGCPWLSCVYSKNGGAIEFRWRASSIQWLVSKGWAGDSFINSFNDSYIYTMCLEAQIRLRILCSDCLSLETSTE